MTRTVLQPLLVVTDLDASIAFYRDVVGLEPDTVEPGNVEFATGRCTLVLESGFEEDVLDAFGPDEPGDDRGAGGIVAVDVDSVADVRRRAVETGADVRLEPTEVDWDGGRCCSRT